VTVIAVYGGAFSPPHMGHAMVASWILLTGQADIVLLVPSAAHPFGKGMAPFRRRLDYCVAMASDLGAQVRVSDVELSLPAPNYTINQLRRLQVVWGKGFRLRCVMGADNLALRAKWYGFDDIEREFDPIYAHREGVELPEGVELASPPFPNISSTTVRERLAAGLPINHLVTKSVLPLVLEDYKATR